MRLFPEVISAFAIGCDSWDWHDDAWRPNRMPTSMRPLYDTNDGARARMYSTSGVRLRFVSDTRRLWIQLRYGVFARPIYKGSLVIDGQLAGTFGPDAQQPQWDGVIFESDTAQLRVFDIWLPNMVQTDVVELQIDDNCEMKPADPLPVRWLVYGDSITQGMTSSHPAACAIGLAALACNAEVLNLGVGGAKLIAELATTVPQGKYDILSIAYGTNDFNQNVQVADYQANAASLLDALTRAYPDKPIVLITPLTWASRTHPNANGCTLEDFRAALRQVAQGRANVTLLEGTDLIPDDESFFVDKVHPNDAGFKLYGEKLIAAVQQLLSLQV